jgi:hypothetical protein
LGRPSAPATKRKMCEGARAHFGSTRDGLGLSAIFDVHPELMCRSSVSWRGRLPRASVEPDEPPGSCSRKPDKPKGATISQRWQHPAGHGSVRGEKPRGPGNKDEGARQAVNGWSNPPGDAGPTPGCRLRSHILWSSATYREQGFEGREPVTRKAGRAARNVTNPRTGTPVQYPERVEEEQAVKVVENHGGGTRDRLATGPRSGHGHVLAGVGSSAPKTVKGRSLETRTRRRETT